MSEDSIISDKFMAFTASFIVTSKKDFSIISYEMEFSTLKNV